MFAAVLRDIDADGSDSAVRDRGRQRSSTSGEIMNSDALAAWRSTTTGAIDVISGA